MNLKICVIKIVIYLKCVNVISYINLMNKKYVIVIMKSKIVNC